MSAIPNVQSAPARAGAQRGVFRQLMRRPLAALALAYLVAIVGVAVIAPLVLPGVAHQDAGDLGSVLAGPSPHHFLGTDSLGRDVLERLMVGARVTLLGVAEAAVIALGVGVPVGLAAGYLGGRFDRTVGWVTDLAFAVPALAIVLVVLTVFSESLFAAMLVIGLLSAPWIARVVRSATLPVREELYISAARVAGLSRPYIITRHVLPRIRGTVIVYGSIFCAGALLAEAGLAFLGLVVRVPAPSWGGMITDGIANLPRQPWLIWPPGVAITLTTLSLCVLADEVSAVNTAQWAPQSPLRRTQKRRLAVETDQADSADDADAQLRVRNLRVSFPTSNGPTDIVDGVSFTVAPGEIVGVVGESGCGKTITAMALLGLLPGAGEVTGGHIRFDGQDLVRLSDRELESVRGRSIGVVSQEPMASLNPAFRIGWQLGLANRRLNSMDRRAARDHAVDLLRMVHLPDPEVVARRYPHELSGGMAQRVAIARALAGNPKLLIADEPTTALDVTVQAEILDLLRELSAARGMAILLVTHDWGVVADLCERAIVMYAGQMVEQASVSSLFLAPRHPYTAALLHANPHSATSGGRLAAIPGNVPKPGEWPQGCHFHPRCSLATVECRVTPIPLAVLPDRRETRCIHHAKLTRSAA